MTSDLEVFRLKQTARFRGAKPTHAFIFEGDPHETSNPYGSSCFCFSEPQLRSTHGKKRDRTSIRRRPSLQSRRPSPHSSDRKLNPRSGQQTQNAKPAATPGRQNDATTATERQAADATDAERQAGTAATHTAGRKSQAATGKSRPIAQSKVTRKNPGARSTVTACGWKQRRFRAWPHF